MVVTVGRALSIHPVPTTPVFQTRFTLRSRSPPVDRPPIPLVPIAGRSSALLLYLGVPAWRHRRREEPAARSAEDRTGGGRRFA